jgi:D-alanyl-D-alanine endopeptidase (penicillin-binding protein 7)
MLATIGSRPMVIVLLDSLGKYSRMGDAQRIKHWLETGESLPRRRFGPAALRPAAALRPPGSKACSTGQACEEPAIEARQQQDSRG